mgnify:CR=1 FL=1
MVRAERIDELQVWLESQEVIVMDFLRDLVLFELSGDLKRLG